MKDLINIFSIELLFLYLLVSCSVEKRHYLPGYHIEWESRNKLNLAPTKNVIKEKTPQATKNEISLVNNSEVVTKFAPSSATRKKNTISPKVKTENRIISNKKSNAVTLNNNNNGSVPYRNNKKENKKSQDVIFAILGGFIGLLTFGAFKIGEKKIKNISYWANNNKWKSRGALTGIKLFLGTLGVYFGSVLFKNDIIITNTITNALMMASLLTAFLYPVRQKKGEKYRIQYARQKTFDLALSMSGFMLMASVGNQASASKDYFPIVSEFNHQIDKKVDLFVPNSFYASSGSLNLSLRMNEKDNVKENAKDSSGEVIGKIFLTILAFALFALLEALILGLSCSLSCNGSEAAAIIVGVGGTVLNVLLLVAIMRAIFKKKGFDQK